MQKIRYFSEIFINIADAIVKCQNNHKNNVLLHHFMYADDFNDWKTSQNIILIIFCLVLKNGFAKSSPILYFEKTEIV